MAEVLIGCKLSNGLIMELFPEQPKEREKQQLHPGQPLARIVLKGANSLRTDRRANQGHHPYAITRVDKAFWDKWLAANANLDCIKRGLVFEAASEREASGMAKERNNDPTLRTGLEGLAPEKDPRLPHGRTPESRVETDTEMAQRTGSSAVAV